jgi:hypothetical protein
LQAGAFKDQPKSAAKKEGSQKIHKIKKNLHMEEEEEEEEA